MGTYRRVLLAITVALAACATSNAGDRRTTAAQGRAGEPREADERERGGDAEETTTGQGDARGAAAQHARDEEPRYDLDPLVIEVDPESGESAVYDARSLLDAGNDALVAGEPAHAIAYYDKLAGEFASSSLVVPALYNKALALERLGEHDAAIDQYLELADRVGEGRDAIDALVRAGAVMAELGRWPAAIELFEELLQRDDLTPSDRVEARARLGYALYENKQDPDAEAVLLEAIDLSASTRDGEHLETTYYVAMAHFYLGMIPRRQFSELPLRLPDEQMERDIEAKAELVVLAHERLSRAIRLGHPDWATAAGYELGSMQEEFWRALVTAPIPPHLGPDAVEAYTEEVHRQARDFLDRALNLYRRTVELAEAHRTATRFSRAAEERAERVIEILARERAGDLVTPERTRRPSTEPADATWDVASYIPSRIDL